MRRYIEHNNEKWKPLGEGTFNHVYINQNRTKVFKVIKDPDDPNQTDTPERSVRLWNMINSNINPPAEIVTMDNQRGWICPFIAGNPATDNEVSHALIDIYNRTGRVIVDAHYENFRKTPDNQVVCIDIGMAVQLERQEDQRMHDMLFSPKSELAYHRRLSIVSNRAWNDLKTDYNDYFASEKHDSPKTIATTKALLFIKQHRPDILDVSFLKTEPKTVAELAKSWDLSEDHTKVTPKALSILRTKQPLTLQAIKNSCKQELQRYIDSRGSIDADGNFTPSVRTMIFRDTAETKKKIADIMQLIRTLDEADSLLGISQQIRHTATNDLLKSGFLTVSGLGSSLLRCLSITDKASKSPYFELESGKEKLNPPAVLKLRTPGR